MCNWTTPDGKNRNHIDYIRVQKRRRTSSNKYKLSPCAGAAQYYDYNPRDVVIKDETGTTFTESDNILGNWKKNGEIMFKVNEMQDVEQEDETENRLPEDVEQEDETENRLPEDVEQEEETNSRVPEADREPLRSDVEWAITYFEIWQITWQLTWH